MDCPARWERTGQILDHLSHQLLHVDAGRHDLSLHASTWDELTRHYFAEESKLRPQVDEAARELARTKQAPDAIVASTRYYLALRLMCALDFLGMVFPPKAQDAPFGDVPKNWTDEQVIGWLLVDLWTRRFDTWLKLDAMSAMGPFRFYGLEPADPNAAE